MTNESKVEENRNLTHTDKLNHLRFLGIDVWITCFSGSSGCDETGWVARAASGDLVDVGRGPFFDRVEDAIDWLYEKAKEQLGD